MSIDFVGSNKSIMPLNGDGPEIKASDCRITTGAAGIKAGQVPQYNY